MRLADFDYDLPPELIATHPTGERRASRLLMLDAQDGSIADRLFRDFPSLLQPNDLLVFNDTRVIRARLHGRKQTGGKVEILIERIISGSQALAHIKASKSPRIDTHIESRVAPELVSAAFPRQPHTEPSRHRSATRFAASTVTPAASIILDPDYRARRLESLMQDAANARRSFRRPEDRRPRRQSIPGTPAS